MVAVVEAAAGAAEEEEGAAGAEADFWRIRHIEDGSHPFDRDNKKTRYSVTRVLVALTILRFR
jgi:hypothetical protein